jgi:F-type H+-transporting ATPase subunit gamma
LNDGNGSIKICYMKLRNRLVQVPAEEAITPVKNEKIKEDRYEFEPDVEDISKGLVEYYVATVVFSKLFESKVSELYSRQNTMRNATENAQDVIKNLTLEFNKARQTLITQELVEIVSGADALKE